MGIDIFKKKPAYDAHTQVSITQSGQDEVDGDYIKGGEFIVLASLSQHSPKTVTNLARDVRMDTRQVSKIVQQLRAKGYAKINDFSGE